MNRHRSGLIRLVCGVVMLVAGGIALYVALDPVMMMFVSDRAVLVARAGGALGIAAGVVYAVLGTVDLAKS